MYLLLRYLYYLQKSKLEKVAHFMAGTLGTSCWKTNGIKLSDLFAIFPAVATATLQKSDKTLRYVCENLCTFCQKGITIHIGTNVGQQSLIVALGHPKAVQIKVKLLN